MSAGQTNQHPRGKSSALQHINTPTHEKLVAFDEGQ